MASFALHTAELQTESLGKLLSARQWAPGGATLQGPEQGTAENVEFGLGEWGRIRVQQPATVLMPSPTAQGVGLSFSTGTILQPGLGTIYNFSHISTFMNYIKSTLQHGFHTLQ